MEQRVDEGWLVGGGGGAGAAAQAEVDGRGEAGRVCGSICEDRCYKFNDLKK